jgi:hypothetical protein
MKCLVAVADACKDKKGGVMASCVHGFLQHGDPVIRDTAKNLLEAVSFYSQFDFFICDFNSHFIQVISNGLPICSSGTIFVKL